MKGQLPVNTNLTLMKRLMKSKEHRKAFVASQIKIGIPFQIRALREKRGQSQQEVATAAGMLQPRISAMESPGYGSLNLDTLQRIAAAFDVGLVVRFAPFSELMKWSETFSADEFEVADFEKESEGVDATTESPFSHWSSTTDALTKLVETVEQNYTPPVYLAQPPLANLSVTGTRYKEAA